VCQFVFVDSLADHILLQYCTQYSRLLAGYYHLSVCLFVRPSVRLLSKEYCGTALRVGVGVESCTVVFRGGDFLLTSSDTYAVGCIV